MKPRTVVISLGSALILGQSLVLAERKPEVDPVVKAIREFKPGHHMKPNEVTVILPPPEEAPKAQAVPDPTAPDPDKPAAVETVPPKAEAPVGSGAERVEPGDEAPRKSGTGLSVTVEKLKVGEGQVDTSKVKLSTPFPAKPLNAAPAGWRIEAPDKVAPITKEVELAPGKTITLSIRPHLLVPETDGNQVFSISEPNFDPTQGYRQTATVGAVLSDSIREVEENSKQMSAAIDQLQQLLASLPKSEPPPPVAVPANPPPARTPLRRPSKQPRITP